MPKRPPPRLATVPATGAHDSDVVAVLVPAGWMNDIRDKLDRILRRGEGGGGPLPPKAVSATGEYMTCKEVAAFIKYDPKTVRRLVKAGKLKAYGPRLDRFKPADVERMMATPIPANATDEDREIAEAQARLHADDPDDSCE